MVKKVLVTFSKDQYQIIQKFKGKVGSTDAEVVRNIFIAYLSEKTYLKGMVMGP